MKMTDDLSGLPDHVRRLIEQTMAETGATALVPEGMAEALAQVEGDPQAAFLPVRVRTRLVEAGIEVSLKAEAMTATVIIDPLEFSDVTGAALSHLSVLVHEALNNFMEQHLDGVGD